MGLVDDLAEANRRGGEAEQFLNYAPEEEIRLHRRRVVLAQQSQVFGRGRPRIPMPEIRGGKSVWEPPPGLLDYEQALRLPLGSQVRWAGDFSEGGLRTRTATGWRPMLGPWSYYWLHWQPTD